MELLAPVAIVSALCLLAWQSGAVLYLGSWLIARQVRGGEVAREDGCGLAGLRALEERWRDIRRELVSLMEAREFPSFHRVDPLQTWLATYGGRRWRVFVLYAFGEWLEDGRAACPETTRLLEAMPGLELAMFSVLEPGKEIPWHRGPNRGVLRYHLGLMVPAGGSCFLDVGEHRYRWREGEGVVFDDTLRHRAVNDSDEPRVVLFLDLTRPDLPEPAARVHRCTRWLMRHSWRIRRALRAARRGQEARWD
jgi:ornithine lipid ester-linked acyl 2-hydroxylase